MERWWSRWRRWRARFAPWLSACVSSLRELVQRLWPQRSRECPTGNESCVSYPVGTWIRQSWRAYCWRRLQSSLDGSGSDGRSDVQVAHVLCISLDEQPARLDLVAHQLVEQLGRG